ncbi:DUF3040 domain-containing protein [Natronoglycomyces albus]|uniref:DUF3040 domain-containing protein n=1 Tax=Natronoglycomyces albus TaxID=2811108 RepID=A0A895XPL7_9ACTN|nr:DUF3040 domain-containing protein [Natronoglycomyces albus]QSB04220.1 DUF3040 domain-containing protein [Natronoglycomyces albus]
MPLSEHEQRLFDEIEQSLQDDPQFASAVRANDPSHVTRRRMIIAGLISFIGLGVIIGGVMSSNATYFAPAGAVLMFAGLLFGLRAQRKGATGELRAVDGKASRKTGSGGKRNGPSGGGSSFGDRMEERWRRRRDTGDYF